jgi:tricarballylate dehydrogenase
LPPMYGPYRADTLAELATTLGLDAADFTATLATYNAAVLPGNFDPTLLDDCHTEGLEIPKSHWAQRIDRPPFFGIAMRPGITFTYLGVKVDDDARVLREDGSGFANVFAAGEIMSGNVLSSGYLAGFGLTIGTVWGRIAGSRAAELAGS